MMDIPDEHYELINQLYTSIRMVLSDTMRYRPNNIENKVLALREINKLLTNVDKDLLWLWGIDKKGK